MFESLSDRLQGVFQRIGNRGRLTEKDIDEAMREVRRALIEADVNLGVVREFVAAVKERALGAEVLKSLTPGQQVIKIVNEELIALLGTEQVPLARSSQPPTVIMLVGLQGAGKTTHAAKLAVHLRKSGQTPLLVAADVYRPAAVTQLQALVKQINLPVYDEARGSSSIAGSYRAPSWACSSTVVSVPAWRLSSACRASAARGSRALLPIRPPPKLSCARMMWCSNSAAFALRTTIIWSISWVLRRSTRRCPLLSSATAAK
jgi:signal recognition particle GTPase